MDRNAVLGVGVGAARDSLEEGVESSGGLFVFFLNFIQWLKPIKVQESV